MGGDEAGLLNGTAQVVAKSQVVGEAADEGVAGAGGVDRLDWLGGDVRQAGVVQDEAPRLPSVRMTARGPRL